MLHFIQSQPSILDRLLAQIESPPFVDLVFRIIQVEDLPGGAGVIDVRPSLIPSQDIRSRIHCSGYPLSSLSPASLPFCLL